MKIDSIRNFGKLLLLTTALSIFISGCAGRCGPRPTPEDDDPRVVEERSTFNAFTDNILSLKFLSIFCTKEY